jgi:hypothetical protein
MMNAMTENLLKAVASAGLALVVTWVMSWGFVSSTTTARVSGEKSVVVAVLSN